MEARVLDPRPDPDLDPEAFYHPHEEDRVPVSGMHDAIVLYLESALGAYLPQNWVAADLCCYWLRGNNRVYLAPDVFVAGCAPPQPLPSSFRLWEHESLRLVIEVGSRTSLRRDVGPKLERYAEGLLPDEYLYYDADHRDLRLHRRNGDRYEVVRADEDGRLWSEAAGAGFAMEGDGFLRAFNAEGEPLASLAEALEQLEGERQRAGEEAALRRAVEERAAEAERERAELRERLAVLEAELTRRDGEGN
jgi:Uma2 family endonuclease